MPFNEEGEETEFYLSLQEESMGTQLLFFYGPLLKDALMLINMQDFLVVIRTCVWYNIFTESTHDRVVTSRVYEYRIAGIHRKGGDADDGL